MFSDMAYKKGSVTKLTTLPFPPVPYGTELLSSQGLSLGPVLNLIVLDSSTNPFDRGGHCALF